MPPIPSEFAGFVRETGVRAFDTLAERASELDPPLRQFVRSWGRLSDDDKRALFDELIALLQTPETGEEPRPKKTAPRKSRKAPAKSSKKSRK